MSTIKLLLLFLSFGDLAAVQWSTSYSNRSVVCTGNRITLGWNFKVVSGETVEVIEWFFTPKTTHTRKSIAVFRNKKFTTASEYGTRLKKDGWIATLSGSTEADAGTYEVQITASPKTRSDSTIRRDLVVDVAGPAVRNALTMNQQFISDANGVCHVRLTCGEFTWPGQPPVDPVWQTPVESELNSTGYEKGRFYLVLDNPVMGGNYECRLPASVLPALCMTQDGLDPLQASINVDAVGARVVLIGAEIKKDKLKHAQEIQQVNEDNRQLAEQLEQMKADILKQAQEIQQVKGENRHLDEELQQTKKDNLKLAQQMQQVKGENRHLAEQHQPVKRDNLTQARLIRQLRGDNPKLSRQLRLVQANIGFHVKLNKDITLNAGELVTFEAIMSNRGNGYDEITGLFTAPQSGYYFFIYTVTPYMSGQWCGCILMANSDYLSWTRTKGDSSLLNPSTGHAVVFLTSGVKVGLYSSEDRSQFQYDSLFSGFLIGAGTN